jgi:hypothetical protein
VSSSVNGLSPATLYHFRALATNAAGTTYGADQTFTTTTPPTATTQPAVAVGLTGATLTGSINPKGQATTYHFDWGETAAYGSKSPSADASVGSDSSRHLLEAALSGLTPRQHLPLSHRRDQLRRMRRGNRLRRRSDVHDDLRSERRDGRSRIGRPDRRGAHRHGQSSRHRRHLSLPVGRNGELRQSSPAGGRADWIRQRIARSDREPCRSDPGDDVSLPPRRDQLRRLHSGHRLRSRSELQHGRSPARHDAAAERRRDRDRDAGRDRQSARKPDDVPLRLGRDGRVRAAGSDVRGRRRCRRRGTRAHRGPNRAARRHHLSLSRGRQRLRRLPRRNDLPPSSSATPSRGNSARASWS